MGSNTTTDQVWKKGDTLICQTGKEESRADLLHDSPPEQEKVWVELLEDHMCMEAGEIVPFQRHQLRKAHK